MKILINSGKVTPMFFPRFELIKSIKNQGWDISASGFESDGKVLCDKYGIAYFVIPFEKDGLNLIKDYRAIRHYQRIMKKEQFDIVHSYTTKPNIYGSIAAKRAGIKKIYPTVNGLGYSFTDTGKGIKKWVIQTAVSKLYKMAFACATKVFFQNIDDADLMIKQKIISKDKCVIISGSGIELDKFPYSDPPVTSMRFLLATRLLLSKGVRTFLEAAKIVKEKYPNAEFVVAGEIDSNPDSIKIEELKTYTDAKIVDYIGYIRNMPVELSQCSVFVLPSYYREGIPHAILEAMSIGRAVITANTPGCRETIKDADISGKGKNGFLIEPRNQNMLAERMIWMIEHPDDVKIMGQESRKYAENRFDVQKVNKIILETMGIV